MTREEQRELQRQQTREQRKREREAWEAARGPLDLPFLLLVILLLSIGLIMLLSASFPSAQASEAYKNDPLYFFKRQAFFAAGGLFGMFTVSKINYQRLRGTANIAIILSIALLVVVLIPGIGKTGNLETHIFQIYSEDSLTDTIEWVAMDDAEYNAFVPYYPMLTTDTYKALQTSTAPATFVTE